MSVDRSQAIAIAEAFLHDEVEPGVGQEVIVHLFICCNMTPSTQTTLLHSTTRSR